MRKLEKIVLYPIMTERTISLIEKANTLSFVVDVKATKHDVRRAVEGLYGVKVASVNTLITSRGKKKAFVKLREEFKASDLAIKLGIL